MVNWGKSLMALFKYVVVSVLGIIVAILGAGLVAFHPANPVEQVIFYAVTAIITGIIGMLKNIIQHWGGAEPKAEPKKA